MVKELHKGGYAVGPRIENVNYHITVHEKHMLLAPPGPLQAGCDYNGE